MCIQLNNLVCSNILALFWWIQGNSDSPANDLAGNRREKTPDMASQKRILTINYVTRNIFMTRNSDNTIGNTNNWSSHLNITFRKPAFVPKLIPVIIIDQRMHLNRGNSALTFKYGYWASTDLKDIAAMTTVID